MDSSSAEPDSIPAPTTSSLPPLNIGTRHHFAGCLPDLLTDTHDLLTDIPDLLIDAPHDPLQPLFYFPSDTDPLRTPLSDFDENEFCRDYPSGQRSDGSTVIPPQQDSFADPYLFPLLARNELKRLTSLWYYTKFIQNDHDLLAQLQGAVDVVHDVMQQDCTFLGLMDNDNYTHIVTHDCPLSTIPRRQAPCAHTIIQESDTVFSLPNMLEDWRFAASPSVEAGMRSYVGTQLLYRLPGTDVEIAFGSLCVSSNSPRPAPTAVQTATLKRLAKTMVHMIVERANIQRRNVQEEMIAKLSRALPSLNPSNVIERRVDVLRECYPSCHVSYQIQQDDVVRLRGGIRVPSSQVHDSLWEATDAILKIILLDNHVPIHLWRPNQAVRAIVVRVPSADDAYLVVETDDLKTVFDTIDVSFIVQCAMTISNVVMSADLDAAVASKDRFLRGMTHDLRTPIHAIIASAELLREGTADGEPASRTPERATSRHMLGVIEDQGNHLLTMVNNLIRLNHLGIADQYDLSKSMQSLAAIEQSIVEGITGSAAYAEQRTDVAVLVDNQLPPAVELILTNAGTLALALGSLLGHALSTTARGSVCLRTSVPPDRAFLDYEVTDTGSGLVPRDWGRIFPSAEPAAPPDGHPRLGLATVSRIANALNGTLALVSCTPGQGAHFRLRLHKPVLEPDGGPESARRRLKKATMPLTYCVVAGDGRRGGVSEAYAARQLERLGFVETLKDGASIVLDHGRAERLAVEQSVHEWQTVLLLVHEAAEGARDSQRPSDDPRVLCCPSPLSRARLWAVVEAASQNYRRRGSLPSDASPATRTSTPSAGDAPRPDRSSIRLLIVDDNDINVKILVMYAKRRGYAHATARDGQEAVDRFAKALGRGAAPPPAAAAAGTGTVGTAFELVLMDLQMPRMDGEEATRRIRVLERDAGAPPSLVYIVSGQSSDQDRTRALAAGADGYYVKPCSMRSLDELIALRFQD